MDKTENRIVLIAKNGFCPACMMSKKVLHSKGVSFTVKHLHAKDEAGMMKLRNHLRDMGLSSFPIVMPDGKIDKKTFCGFHPDKLQALAD